MNDSPFDPIQYVIDHPDEEVLTIHVPVLKSMLENPHNPEITILTIGLAASVAAESCARSRIND